MTLIQDLLKRLMLGGDLDEAEMTDGIGAIMDGAATPVQIAGFLIALRKKGETVDEITGAARAMRARMSRVDIARQPLIDTCGTGGDGAGTFNISTAVAFIAAAGGAAVAKHGNRAVSSRCGSADVLAELGINIEAGPDVAARCIEDVGVGFLFAPGHHPAMKHAAPVRRELGVRTVFNLLGPLTNPAGAPRQLIGVFDAALVRPMAEVLGRLGCERAWVVHGDDGLDELSVCDQTRVAEWTGDEVRELVVTPEDLCNQLGLARHSAEGLKGGTPAENAGIMRELLAGERPGAIRDAVALNAGAALMIAGLADDLATGVARAAELIDSGAGLTVLEQLIVASRVT